MPGTWVPLVNLRGTYVLPGVPRLFRSMLEAHIGRFAGRAHRQAELLTDMGEGDLAGAPHGFHALAFGRVEKYVVWPWRTTDALIINLKTLKKQKHKKGCICCWHTG